MSVTVLDDDTNAAIYQPRRRPLGLTALIDVVFILLMFFMLTSTFVRWHAVDFAVPAPSATTPAAPPPLQLVLDAAGALTTTDGTTRLGHYRALRSTVLRDLGVSRAIVLHPRDEATLESIVGASEALLRAGARDVALGTLATPAAAP